MKPEEIKLEFVDLYDPMRMIERVIRNIPSFYKGPKSTFYWLAVRDVFGYGSTTSQQLCIHFKINPYSELQDDNHELQ